MEENWKFDHVGVVVRDMDKAVEYYQSLGTVTFQPEVTVGNSVFTDLKVYGKTPATKFKIKSRWPNKIGSLTVDLFEPVEGESVWKEFLDSRGEGVIILAFIVDDLKNETAKLVEKGFPVILSGKTLDGTSLAYFDTRKVGGVVIQLYELAK